MLYQQNSRTYSSFLTETTYLLNSNSLFLLLLQTLATTILLVSVFVSLPIVGTPFKWNHAIFVFSVAGLIHLVYSSPGSSMLLHMAGFPLLGIYPKE